MIKALISFVIITVILLGFLVLCIWGLIKQRKTIKSLEFALETAGKTNSKLNNIEEVKRNAKKIKNPADIISQLNFDN